LNRKGNLNKKAATTTSDSGIGSGTRSNESTALGRSSGSNLIGAKPFTCQTKTTSSSGEQQTLFGTPVTNKLLQQLAQERKKAYSLAESTEERGRMPMRLSGLFLSFNPEG